MNTKSTPFSPFETSQFNTIGVVAALVAHVKYVTPISRDYTISEKEAEEELCNWALMQYFGSEAQA